jgi:hypothetical protein
VVLKTEQQPLDVVHEQGYVFGFVDDYQLLNLDAFQEVDAVVVKSHTPAMTSYLVKRIRTSTDTYTYLLPVFVWGDADSLPVAIKQVIDGTLPASGELKQYAEVVNRIKQNLQNFW